MRAEAAAASPTLWLSELQDRGPASRAQPTFLDPWLDHLNKHRPEAARGTRGLWSKSIFLQCLIEQTKIACGTRL